MMTGAAALGLSSSFGMQAASHQLGSGPAIVKPPRLNLGDTVGLISPASLNVDSYDYDMADEVVEALGLVPKRGKNVGRDFGYFSAPDKDRAADVNAMFADKSVKGIFAIRGGWGCARILPYLDYDMIAKNPKPLIGYSDITALHMALHAKTGLVSFHGPNATAAWGQASVDSFKPLLFDGAQPTYSNPEANEDRLVQRKWRTRILTGGTASGRLMGGNLTVLTAMVGTPYMPNMDGAILFIEDVGEAEYRIDRMLTQLGQAGHLKGLKGVIFGQCTKCTTSGGSGFTLTEVLKQHIVPLGVPAFQGAFFGHMSDQYTIPFGTRAIMDADAGTLRMLEPSVT
ncbi:LD-carboxypeptidase [Fretibacter rubidus]|uniref:S66 peptidase family protein n=1 Tax=Fretibacter rubidus TaxID=570162 RepID=UPI00352BA189